ncbi:TPA: GBS Bsp-like repeat-containing protein, partial [Streptococcus suis]
MKKKTLLFLSLCAWTLQSHLVQADTIAETANQASQETETLSLSNSNTSTSTLVSQQATTAVSGESTKQPESLNAEAETTSDTQTVSSESVESTDKASELVNQAESVSSNLAVSNTTNSTQDSNSEDSNFEKTQTPTSSNSTISERSAVTVSARSASVSSNNAVAASATSSTTNTTSTPANTSVATRSAATSPTQSSTSTKTSNIVAVENVNAVNGSFDVRVSKVSSPKEIKTVYMPTWSEVHGQDDIIWYAAKRQLDGSYLINVNNDQHKNSVGKYHSHVYYLATDGSLSAIGATSTVLPEVKASGTVAAVNVNSNTGSFEVKVSNIV